MDKFLGEQFWTYQEPDAPAEDANAEEDEGKPKFVPLGNYYKE